MLASSASAWRCSLLRPGSGDGTAIGQTVSESVAGDGRSANTELKNRRERAVYLQSTWRGCEPDTRGRFVRSDWRRRGFALQRSCAACGALDPGSLGHSSAYKLSNKSTHRRGAIALRQNWSRPQPRSAVRRTPKGTGTCFAVEDELPPSNPDWRQTPKGHASRAKLRATAFKWHAAASRQAKGGHTHF
jgi:hypothetical protein